MLVSGDEAIILKLNDKIIELDNKILKILLLYKRNMENFFFNFPVCLLIAYIDYKLFLNSFFKSYFLSSSISKK